MTGEDYILERLHKYIARAGIASRRKAEQMIEDGRVKVNGKLVNEMGCVIDPEKDKVTVNNKLVIIENKLIYLMLNKPAGVVTSVTDPQKRKTVIDLLAGVSERVYPVGRLDYLTEGLLLLTNDGDLAFRLTHPRYKVPKTYAATVRGIIKESSLDRLKRGVVLEDGPTLPAVVKPLSYGKNETKLEITIREGRNRQVRRMCQHVGYPVIHLERKAFGPLTLKGLKLGQYRFLKAKEILAIKKAVDLKI